MEKYDCYAIDDKYATRDRVASDFTPLSDEYLGKYIEYMAKNTYHPAGSCKMGAVGDRSAVVDPQLR